MKYLLENKESERLRYRTLKESDFESALAYLETQRVFLEDHLGAWVAEFAANIEKNAETEFYKNLALLTRIFVHGDFKNITEVSIANLNASSTDLER